MSGAWQHGAAMLCRRARSMLDSHALGSRAPHAKGPLLPFSHVPSLQYTPLSPLIRPQSPRHFSLLTVSHLTSQEHLSLTPYRTHISEAHSSLTPQISSIQFSNPLTSHLKRVDSQCPPPQSGLTLQGRTSASGCSCATRRAMDLSGTRRDRGHRLG